jgi:phosphate starvation-inducible PhoH-like protein
MARKSKKTETSKSPIKAKNPKQLEYIRALKKNQLIVATGAAGVGKTFVPTCFGSDWYVNNKIDKLLLTRPNVPAGRSLGHFPGSLEEKMGPWVSPFIDTMLTRMSTGMFECGMKNGNIEFCPFETMRGRSFENAVIILDEAQNTTEEEMKMFLTRIGERSTTVICGDVTQSDIAKNNGLTMLVDILENYEVPESTLIEFTSDDIVRGGMCKTFVKIFEGSTQPQNGLRDISFMQT